MPLMRPMTHSGTKYRLTPLTKEHCSSCPEAWFNVNFDTEFIGGTQGVYIGLPTKKRPVREEMASPRPYYFDEFTWLPIDEEQALVHFEPWQIFAVGRDGYYLTLEEARLAIDASKVHGVHYHDDFDDELQGYFICKDDDDHTPYAEAHVSEPIR